MNKKIKIIIVLVLTLILSIGGIYYVQKESQNPHLSEKETKLYKHGFRLLEERIATYLKEHYTGISKIEFSPILVQGDGKMNMRTAKIVPVIYDQFGNREILGDSGKIKNGSPNFGLFSGLWLDFNYKTEHVVILEHYTYYSGEVDVSKESSLPERAKLSVDRFMDRNISYLVEKGYIRNVKKTDTGSPRAEIKYNLEVTKGDYAKWH